MHQYFDDQWAYQLFSDVAIFATMISSLFYFKSKRKSISLYSRYAIRFVSQLNSTIGKIVEFILVSVELLLMAGICLLSTNFNKPFGEFVGTGLNYFGLLSTVSIFWFIASLILMANPLKQIDVATMFLPIHLFFVKIACYCAGCCGGIPWEYGPYNYNSDHTGNQVPVQAIEAFWALAIFAFLLWYRKKAKTGTTFPMYMILYCATRFCSEFLRHEENVFWIFKTYHLLCLAGITVGIILFFIFKFYGDKISTFFDKPHAKFDLKIAQYEEKLRLEAEAAEAIRKEKIKQARNRAKARRGKKVR